MKKFRNKEETKKVGERIQQLREAAGYNIGDIAEMTEFSYQMISNIEKGSEPTLSYIIEIAKAIGVSPQEIFAIEFGKEPRRELSPQRKEMHRVTRLIKPLYANSNFFDDPKFVREVIEYFDSTDQARLDSNAVSLVLSRMVKDGDLLFNRVGRQKQYYKQKT